MSLADGYDPPKAVLDAQAALLQACETWNRTPPPLDKDAPIPAPEPLAFQQQATLCKVAEDWEGYSGQVEAYAWMALTTLILGMIIIYRGVDGGLRLACHLVTILRRRYMAWRNA